jgi:hypothetical protein
MRFLILLAALLTSARAASACSAFMLHGTEGPIVAKSYDWHQEHGLVLINKKDVRKRALVLSAKDKAATWTSTHASVTFNQYGAELPNGGMNDAGLVVEVLMLPSSEFARADDRSVVTEAGFVQYLLDQAASLDEALALADDVRVAPAYAKIHYFVCDVDSKCASLEFIAGRLVATTGEAMPVCAITNSTYAQSKASLAETAASMSSLGRFNRIAQQLTTSPNNATPASAWALLDKVSFDTSTQWQVVYEPSARRVAFRTLKHRSKKSVSLAAFKPGCADPVMMQDMASDAEGDISADFVAYSEDKNRALVQATYGAVRKVLPKGMEQVVVTLPRSQSCTVPFSR